MAPCHTFSVLSCSVTNDKQGILVKVLPNVAWANCGFDIMNCEELCRGKKFCQGDATDVEETWKSAHICIHVKGVLGNFHK